MLRIGVIGYGYWGPNLVRNFNEAPGAKVVAISDMKPERIAKAQARYPSIRTTTDPRDLYKDPQIDAVVIATPVSRHFEMGMAALAGGKHILVEKPLTASSEEAARLIDEAAKRGKVLMVDHTFAYTHAVRVIRDLVADGKLGRLLYYDSVRVNLGLFQHDVNVLWDLAVHDLSIMDFALGAFPRSVSATGIAHYPNQPVDVGYLTCQFDGGLIAHFHVNWLSPVKVRRTLIGGDRQMIVYDDLDPGEKVKVYDRGVDLAAEPEAAYRMMVNYRLGDMWAPKTDRAEALAVEALHFIECVEKGIPPLTDGQAGLRVVRILEAADRSLAAGGRPIELSPRDLA